MCAERSGVCLGGPKLVFACSGAADVGEISDRAARRLTQDGSGKMFCLAGIGGKIGGIIQKTQAASKILAIDGCELDCVKSCLHQAGFQEFEHFRVTDLGMQKGQAAVNDENVAKVVQHGAALLS
jgi:uncharacterized metal-binding protein